MQQTQVQSLGLEDPLDNGNPLKYSTHSSILVLIIPWTEEPGRLQSMGSQRVRHYWARMHATLPWLSRQMTPSAPPDSRLWKGSYFFLSVRTRNTERNRHTETHSVSKTIGSYEQSGCAPAQFHQFRPTLWTPRTVAHQTPLSMGFSRQEYWSGLPWSPPGDLPNPEIESVSPESPALQVDSLQSHGQSAMNTVIMCDSGVFAFRIGRKRPSMFSSAIDECSPWAVSDVEHHNSFVFGKEGFQIPPLPSPQACSDSEILIFIKCFFSHTPWEFLFLHNGTRLLFSHLTHYR